MIPLNIVVADTETTGVDLATCEIVEVAVHGPALSWESYVKPKKSIPPEVSAIHHICDDDVVDARPWNEVKANLLEQLHAHRITTLAAHNVEYDSAVLNFGSEFSWICTYKCALRQWPDAPSHKNEVLKYWLNLGLRGRKYQHAAHSALHDCKTTELILSALLKEQSVETLIQWSKEPKHFARIAFGKHAGKKWAEIDSGYLQWMCQQSTMDKDLVGCAARELQSRRR